MKNVKFLTGFVVLCICLQACIPSLYPLYKTENLKLDNRIEGYWENSDAGNWDFERFILGGEYTYKLEISEDELLAAHLLELGGQTFMDFYPLEVKSLFSETDFYDTHFMPVHTFAKVELSDEQLTVRFFDTEFLEELLEQKKIRIRNEKVQDGFVLSADTDELQKFVLKYAEDPMSFIDPIIFTKKAQ
ncbi:MAG: hypothetical protein AAF598_06865 [Bacteroidota bacterium]